jgi:hypothetical protein
VIRRIVLHLHPGKSAKQQVVAQLRGQQTFAAHAVEQPPEATRAAASPVRSRPTSACIVAHSGSMRVSVQFRMVPLRTQAADELPERSAHSERLEVLRRPQYDARMKLWLRT